MNISSIGSQISAPASGASPAPANAQHRALIQAVKAMNPTELFGQNTEFTYILNQKLQKMIVRVIDRSTGQIKLQIPAEYLVRLAEEVKGG